MDGRKNAHQLKIGITSNVICVRFGVDGYRHIGEAGFQCVDFNMQRGFFEVEALKYRDKMTETVEKHYRAIKACGLKVSQTHAPYYFRESHITNTADLKKYVDAVIQAIELTSYLKARYIVMHPLYIMPWMPDAGIGNNEELTKKVLEEILPFAEKRDVVIAIENLPYEFCNDLQSHQKFMNIVPSDYISACFDSGHAFITEKEDASLHLKAMLNEIKVVHLHDNNGMKDMHEGIRVEDGKWLEIFKIIRESDQIDCVSLETSGIYKTCQSHGLLEALKRDYETVRCFLNLN